MGKQRNSCACRKGKVPLSIFNLRSSATALCCPGNYFREDGSTVGRVTVPIICMSANPSKRVTPINYNFRHRRKHAQWMPLILFHSAAGNKTTEFALPPNNAGMFVSHTGHACVPDPAKRQTHSQAETSKLQITESDAFSGLAMVRTFICFNPSKTCSHWK